MDVALVEFPATKVAVLEHKGAPALEGQTVKKLIDWRITQGLMGADHKSYGIHYNNPATTPPEDYRVDFCISVQQEIAHNPWGVINKIIPAGRCARVRYVGSRQHIHVPQFLYEQWLPKSNESPGDFPLFFHYVNVGPDIEESEMKTDIYLPLK